MPTFDVVLHTNLGMFAPNYQQLAGTDPPVTDRVQAVSGLYIERLDLELARAIMDTCEPKTLGVMAPVRQFAHMYGYVREFPPQTSVIGWDEDHRLSRLVAISRLIHPTSVGFRYAARVRQDDDSLRIVPAEIHGLSIDTFLSPSHKRDWLTKKEADLAVEIDAKSEPLTQPSFPRRVSRALWYFDYAQKTYYADLRWTLIATALEALIHTGTRGSTKHFTYRVPALATDVGAGALTPDECEAAYDYRSRLSHGDGFLSDMPAADITLYDRLEETLRLAIVKAFAEPDFARLFLDDAAIAARWKA
jgi:hypothetical protein